MNYYYFRVSTKSKRKTEDEEKEFKQNFERQSYIFTSAGHELTKYNQFFDRDSGSKRADIRDGFSQMLEQLQEGDWVYFTETSRFARSYFAGMEILDVLTQIKRVNVAFVSSNLVLEAGVKYNPQIWYIISQFLLADEYQRRIIGEATSKSLQAKKKKGQKLGKPRTVSKEQYDMVKNNMFKFTQKELSEMAGVSISLVSNIINGKYTYDV